MKSEVKVRIVDTTIRTMQAIGRSIPEGVRLSIPVEVDGHPVTAIVDTGADKSLLSRQWADTIGISCQNTPSVRLKGAFMEHSVLGYLVKNIPLRIGSDKFHCDMLVSESEDHLLLGSDFLLENACIIDLDRGILQLHAQEIPLQVELIESTGGCKSCKVSLEESTIIPPWSGQIASGCIPEIFGDQVLVEPLVSEGPLVPSASLNKRMVPICLYNLTTE